MIKHPIIKIFVFSLLFLSVGYARQEKNDLKEAFKLYRENKLEQALPYFERVVKENKENADAFAWLAETYRRLKKRPEAVKTARKALEINSRHSFAHTVIADACNPQYGIWEQSNSDTTWQHLLLAVKYDSNDGNAWMGIWIESMRRGEETPWKDALRAMVRSTFITPALLSYNRWMLHDLPKNAILFTNGDMDTYPAVALQIIEQFRTDVAIVNLSLLNTAWYAHFISKQYHIQLPFPDTEIDSLNSQWGPGKSIITISQQIVQGWLRQKENSRFSLPITISTTVDTASLPAVRNHLKLAGAYWIWSSQVVESPDDIALMQPNMKSIDPQAFKGPFVSPQDRSSIRMYYKNGLARSLIWTILHYSDLLIKGKRLSEASQSLDVAETIDKSIDTGRMFTDEIAKLRKETRP
jgi:hypothetical protein